MFVRLFLLFTAVPLVELTLLLWLAHRTSWSATLALVLTTGVVGAFLARREGFRTLAALQSEMSGGRMPAGGMMDAALILAAGLLLITPGLITDLVGFSLLVRPVRRWIRRRLGAYARDHLVVFGPAPPPGTAPPPPERSVVDVEVISVAAVESGPHSGTDAS